VSVFVDANVLVYSVADSPYREPCLRFLQAVARGEVDGRTSTACLEEVWYLESTRRISGLDGLTQQAYAILTPLLSVTDEVFRRAMSLGAVGLGTNDRVHAATCLTNDIRTIVSADAGFDGLRGLRRVDPADDKSLGEVLRPS
jgi:predicted nucleic acid-binding protein